MEWPKKHNANILSYQSWQSKLEIMCFIFPSQGLSIKGRHEPNESVVRNPQSVSSVWLQLISGENTNRCWWKCSLQNKHFQRSFRLCFDVMSSWRLHFSLCVHCYYCSYFGLVFSTTPWPRLHRHDWYIPGAWRQERCVVLLFHKTSLPNKPGQFQLFGFIVTWFGFWKQNDHSSSSVTVATYAEKLTWFRAG